MNSFVSKYLFFYPATLAKGEPIPFLMRAYRDRQWWSLPEIRKYQVNRLKAIVEHAYNNSKYYRESFDAHGIKPDAIQSLEDFSKIPSITKKDLIENLDNISVVTNKLLVSEKTTGGSTGEPVKLYKNAFALARERCATARSYEWAGVSIGDSQLRFWGVPHSQLGSNKALLTDLIANRKRISAFDITDDSLQSYYKNALSFKPRYIYGYVSVIEKFARFINEKGYGPIPSVVSVITTSEILTDGARDLIAKAFDARVFNEYGCGEVGSVAHECSEGSMHLMSDNLLVEVDDRGDGSGSGELVVTDLFNKATPLIRYRLGDYGTLSERICPCGRSLPIIEKIHGRAYDIIEMPSGKKVHPESIIYVFEGIQSKTKTFKQFQVIQESIDRITVNIIPNENWSNDAKLSLISDLKRDVSNDINYEVNVVESIKRERSGKMRLVKCKLLQ